MITYEFFLIPFYMYSAGNDLLFKMTLHKATAYNLIVIWQQHTANEHLIICGSIVYTLAIAKHYSFCQRT